MTRSSSRGGFTLIEVLVAMVIVTVIGAATTIGLVVTTDLMASNDRYSQAISLAQKQLEDLRTLPYDKIVAGSTESEDEVFGIAWTVTTDPQLVTNGPTESGMKLIVVRVSWEWKGEAKEYVLQTVYSRLSPDFSS